MMIFVWLGILVLMIIFEAVTTQLVSVWFALGALAAFLTTLAGVENVWVQVIVFVAVSAVALAVTRPILKRVIQRKTEPTNADMVLGKTGVVTESIDNLADTGYVKVGGAVWTARSADDSMIGKDEKVTVQEIRGVKLLVTKNI